METFPTFASGVYETNNLVDSNVFSMVRQAPFTSGYFQRSNRATWVPKSFTRSIRVMSDADKTTLLSFMDDIDDGADAFAWTDPLTNTAYHVFISIASLPLRFETDGVNTLWKLKITFEQSSSVEITSQDYGYGEYGDGIYLPA